MAERHENGTRAVDGRGPETPGVDRTAGAREGDRPAGGPAAGDSGAAARPHDTRRSLLPLTVCYLVLHCFTTAVLLALLVVSTLVFSGAIQASEPVAADVVVLGARVPTLWLLVAFWVVGGAFGVAGVAFAVTALLVRRRHALLAPAIVLGRVMFVVSVLDAALSFLQASPVTLIPSLVAAALTGALGLELRRYEDELRRGGERRATPRRSFVVAAAEDAPLRERQAGKTERPLLRSVEGYTSIMLAWGVLRVVMGLAVLVAAPGASSGPWRAPALVFGVAIIVAGAYLILVGGVGKRALAGSSSTLALSAVALVGLVASAITLVVYAVWLWLGWTPDGLLVFCSAADCLLYAAALFYLRRLAVVSG